MHVRTHVKGRAEEHKTQSDKQCAFCGACADASEREKNTTRKKNEEKTHGWVECENFLMFIEFSA